MPEYIVPSEYEGKFMAAEKLIRCRDCRSWQTGIAYSATGKCKQSDRITNRNFYCGDGKEKEHG